MIVEEQSGSANVDPHFHLDLVVAIVDRAVKDFLMDPKRYADALPFVARVANGRLKATGRKRIKDRAKLAGILRSVWKSRGEAA